MKNCPPRWSWFAADGGFCRSGLLQKAAAALGFEPIAIAADSDDVAVVEQPVEDRGRHHRIGEHHAPFADAAVRRDEHRAALVAPADELEEQVRCIGLERQISELVHEIDATAAGSSMTSPRGS